jgi:hypothetical protein
MMRSPGTSRVLVAATAGLFIAASASGQIRRQPRVILTDAERQALVPEAGELATVEVPPEVVELVDRLASESFAAREQAMRELVELRVDRAHLYTMLYREALETEQRYRLLEVLRNRLINEPKGAVGISMRPLRVASGMPIEILVSDLVAGLPAERVLQLQDRIIKVDGNVLMTQDDLVRRVQSKLPGDTVRLTVRRAERNELGSLVLGEDDRPIYNTLEIDMTLGSVSELEQKGNNDVFQSSHGVLRQEEVQVASERFSPKPARIVVHAGFSGQASNDIPSPEEHPLILQVSRSIRAIEAGHLQVTDRLRGQWASQLDSLRQQARDPRLPRAHRAYFDDVADLYERMVVGR